MKNRTQWVFRICIQLVMFLLLFGLVSPIQAQNQTGKGAVEGFGAPDTLILSAERLFGLYDWELTLKEGDAEADVSGQEASLLFSYSQSGQTSGLPRLALDTTLASGMTIGGAVGYYQGKIEADAGGFNAEGPDTTSILIAPRIGFLGKGNDSLFWWVRVGYSLHRIHEELSDEFGSTETTQTLHNINIELLVGIKLSSQVALVVGPVYDLGIGGEVEDKETDTTFDESAESTLDAELTTIGIVGGLSGCF